jgi:predicted nucleic acid-binding protein
MVLVDTSVWIRFLANRPPDAAELDGLLDREEAAGHDLIYGELLTGDAGGRGAMLQSYDLIHRVADVSHEEVVEFVRANKLPGRGIGWIDAHLLASCLVVDVPLWTADDRLASVASEFGISYRATLSRDSLSIARRSRVGAHQFLHATRAWDQPDATGRPFELRFPCGD